MHKLGYPMVLVDLEYTSFGRSLKTAWTKPHHHKEIVQIWAIKLDKNKKEIDFLDIYVKPKINPKLTNRFKKLTQISQEIVDKNWISFKEALDVFIKFTKWYNIVVFDWDYKVFEENCKLNNLEFPFENNPFFRLCEILPEMWLKREDCSSWTMYKHVWKDMNSLPHNALHDVRSMAIFLENTL